MIPAVYNPARREMRVEIRHPVREATLGWMALLIVCFALLVESFRPWQHRNFNPTRPEVLEIFSIAVSGRPDTGEVRLTL